MSFDSALLFAAIAAEIAIVVLLSLRGMWRVVPMFCIYMSWTLLSDISAKLFQSYGISQNYFRFWLIVSEVDNIVGVLVLLEIILAVWRRHNSARNLRDEVLLALLVAAAGLTLWPIVERLTPRSSSHDTAFIFGFQQVLSLMFIACGAVLVTLRRRLSLNWANPEFQVAVGIGFFSAFGLLTSMLQMSADGYANPSLFNRIAQLSYLMTLVFWIRCFSRPRSSTIRPIETE